MAKIAYLTTSGVMALGTTAADVCIFSLTNPTGSKKVFRVTRLPAKGGFSGTAASTKVDFGICRATGTAAGGTGTKATTGIAKRDTGVPDSVALVRFGPAAITGLTADTPADFKRSFINHQNGPMEWEEMIPDRSGGSNVNDAVDLAPGESLAVFTRVSASVAGSSLSVDPEWDEVDIA
jgi:hypothetical protein